jgi:hypothetical protein
VGLCGTAAPHTTRVSLGDLNNDVSLDISDSLNAYISDDENVSQFFQTYIKSNFTDLETFIKTFKNATEPLILSLNIQSLNSKYEKLKLFMQTLLSESVPIDIIILQETWDIKHPAQLSLPGFQNIIFRTREKGRGGGSWYVLEKHS